MQINTLDYGDELTPEGLAYTIAHESGHFFGLAHSPEVGALMFFQSAAGASAAPALSPDDIAAICAAYPPSSTAPICHPDPRAAAFEPARGFAPDCGGDVKAACALAPGSPDDLLAPFAFVLGALLVAAARRRRGC